MMLKVLHVREPQLLQLLQTRKIYIPQNAKISVGEKIILDTETQSALVEILGVCHYECLVALKEVQEKLFPPQ